VTREPERFQIVADRVDRLGRDRQRGPDLPVTLAEHAAGEPGKEDYEVSHREFRHRRLDAPSLRMTDTGRLRVRASARASLRPVAGGTGT
jgi:hypothetical protein